LGYLFDLAGSVFANRSGGDRLTYRIRRICKHDSAPIGTIANIVITAAIITTDTVTGLMMEPGSDCPARDRTGSGFSAQRANRIRQLGKAVVDEVVEIGRLLIGPPVGARRGRRAEPSRRQDRERQAMARDADHSHARPPRPLARNRGVRLVGRGCHRDSAGLVHSRTIGQIFERLDRERKAGDQKLLRRATQVRFLLDGNQILPGSPSVPTTL
jgi:hypothetical protein